MRACAACNCLPADVFGVPFCLLTQPTCPPHRRLLPRSRRAQGRADHRGALLGAAPAVWAARWPRGGGAGLPLTAGDWAGQAGWLGAGGPWPRPLTPLPSTHPPACLPPHPFFCSCASFLAGQADAHAGHLLRPHVRQEQARAKVRLCREGELGRREACPGDGAASHCVTAPCAAAYCMRMHKTFAPRPVPALYIKVLRDEAHQG